jgi:hypothetical protein
MENDSSKRGQQIFEIGRLDCRATVNKLKSGIMKENLNCSGSGRHEKNLQ